jgi:hypothetical protein
MSVSKNILNEFYEECKRTLVTVTHNMIFLFMINEHPQVNSQTISGLELVIPYARRT